MYAFPVRIVLGSDHAGFNLKQALLRELRAMGRDVNDIGAHSNLSVDYPDYAHTAANKVASGEAERGILVCGSGQGMAIAANRHKGVRAALAWDEESARLAREHNDANVLALPARRLSEEDALKVVAAFLETEFAGGRHAPRVNKIDG